MKYDREEMREAILWFESLSPEERAKRIIAIQEADEAWNRRSAEIDAHRERQLEFFDNMRQYEKYGRK